MGRFYLDSSMIVKRYAREEGSVTVTRLYRQAAVGQSRLLFSEWNIGETLSALQKKARQSGRLKAFTRAKGRLHGETASLSRLGSLEIAPVESRLLQSAWAILERRFLFTADALQIATAQDRGCDHFVTADQDLYDAAKLEGLHAVHGVREQEALKALS